MSFKNTGNLFDSLDQMKIGFNHILNREDLTNVDKKVFDNLFKINSDGLSEYTMEQIKAKAATVGLNESLTAQAIALASDADFTAKASTKKLTFKDAFNDSKIDIQDFGKVLEKSLEGQDEYKKQLENIQNSAKRGGDAYKNTIKGFLDANKDFADSILDLGTAKPSSIFEDLAKSAKVAFAAIKPLLPYLAIGGAISAMAYAVDYSRHGFTRAQEKSDSSFEEYQEASSQLESVNQQLDETKKKISELQALKDSGAITFAEENELQRLNRLNEQLERQKNIQEDIYKMKQQASAKDALEASKKEKTYTEKLEEEKGFWGKVKGFLTDGKALRNDIYGDVGVGKNGEGRTDAEKYYDRYKYGTTIEGMVKSDIEILNTKQKELDALNKKIDKADGKMTDSQRAKQKKLTQEINDTRSVLQKNVAELENYISKTTDENGNAVSGYEKSVDKWKKLVTDYSNIGKTKKEKDLNNLQNFFSSSSGSIIEKRLKDVVLSSKNAKDALSEFTRMGFKLSDIDVSSGGLIRYFEDVIRSANEAKEEINSIDGSVQGVEIAFESANQDADWNTMSERLKEAGELYKNRKIGTDDFKAATQFMSPDVINPDAEGFKYDAEAYEKAWIEAQSKIKRYFDSENPFQSVNNFTDDMVKNGLATKVGDDLTWSFKTSAEAADKLGLSVDAVEVLMHNLESYGAEFDDVVWSGDGLKEYENALNGIKSIYDQLDEGAAKDRLGKLISGFDSEYDLFKQDLSKLSEEQIVKIKFEYDLAEITQQINELEGKINAGDDSTVNRAALIVSKEEYLRKSSEASSFDETSDYGYSAVTKQVSEYKAQMVSASDDVKKELQKQASALLDLQNAYQDMWNSGKELSWDEFLQSDEAAKVFEKIRTETNLTKDELLGFYNKYPPISLDVTASTEEVKQKISELNKGQVISFHAKVDGVDTVITAVKNQDGTITYYANVNNTLVALDGVKYENGVITYDADTTKVQSEQNDKNGGERTTKFTPMADAVDAESKKTDGGVRTTIYKADTSLLPKSLSPIYQTVYQKIQHAADTNTKGANSGKGSFLGTARVNGTGGLYPIPQLSGRALALGQLGDPSWLKPQWKTKNSETSLTGELGRELIVSGNRWWTVGDNGAEFADIPKGSIVFNHKQTEELLRNGFTNSRGVARAYGTAYANGMRLPSKSSSTSSKKSASSSKSSSKSTSTSNAEKAAKDALDAISGYFDWVKVRFDRLARETELAENAIESAVGLFEKQSATSKTIEKVQAEINAAKAGADRYLSHANWYAGKSGLSADIQNQVKSGTIDISKYDENTQKKISEYQSWYENYLDALDKVIDLQKKENELAQQRLENIEDFYELVNNVHSSLTDAIDASLELEEMKGFSGVSDSVKQAIQKQIQAAEEVYNQTAKQLADYQAEFNDLVSKGYIKEGSDAWYEGQAKLNEFNKALSEAEMSIIEFDDKLREIEYTKIQNIIDGFDRAVSKLDKKIELMEARDEKIPESLYQEQINTNDSQIIANKQLRDKKLAEMSLYDVNSKRYQELAEEINKLDEETLQLMTDNEKLKDSIFELRFSDLDEAIENYNKLGNEIEDFLGLLNEEAYFDKTGKGTSELAAALALMQQGMIASKQKVSDLQKGLEKLQESFDNGVISEKEYNEKSEEYREGIRDAIATTEKYKDTINDLYMTQMKKEAEATTELIDKYDEARKRKESYFEYDRKLKNQQKSVNLIKAQIAALSGVNNVTAQAQKKRLEEELAQQQESLDDLKRDHKNEMMDLGSEKFKEDINDWLEDTEYEIAHSAQKQEEVISSMLNRVVGNYKDAFDKINQIIGNTGWVGSNGFNQNQSQLGSQSGAQSQHESATKPQGSIKPSGNASGTVTTPIPNNGDFNSKFENEIMQKPNTDNRLCAELKLSTTAISIQEGQTAHVTAQIRPTDAKNKTLTWNSSDVRIATASNGTISGLKPGSCQVTVITTDGSGLSASIGVTVTKKPEPPKPAPPANNNNTGADGVPKVGDAVTFASGFYYYDSQGVTPSGGQMRGQTVYITKINSRSWATKPYHISRTSKFGEHDLGWVSLDQLRGYRSGASFIPENQLAITQEDGKEFILRNGSVLTQLNEGDKIMTRQETDNMYNWSKINPGQFAFSPTYDPVPNITPVNNTVIENHYDSLLTIDGGTITKDSIPDMKKLLMDSYKFTSSMMYKDAKKTGLRKR